MGLGFRVLGFRVWGLGLRRFVPKIMIIESGFSFSVFPTRASIRDSKRSTRVLYVFGN